MQVLSLFRLEEMNNPSLTDHYLMGLTAVVARIFASKPQDVKSEDYRLKFEIVKQKTKEEEEQDRMQQIEWSKAMWIGRAGGLKGITIKDSEGRILQTPEVPIRANRLNPSFNASGRPSSS